VSGPLTGVRVVDCTTVVLGQQVYVGLFVCSHDSGTLNTATFDNVSVTAASGTGPRDIVVRAADLPASARHGIWGTASDTTAAGGTKLTRHIIAAAQMLTSALLIHLCGGRIETHFHIFGSLAFLAFYRDWRVLVPATLVVAADHFLRGIFWPESVYGVAWASSWRSVEHAVWVVFEDVVLMTACLRQVREMHAMALRQAELESSKRSLEASTFELFSYQNELEQRVEVFGQRPHALVVGDRPERVAQRRVLVRRGRARDRDRVVDHAVDVGVLEQ